MRGDGRVFRRGRIWWIAYSHDGREYRESSESRDRRIAVKLLRQRLVELANHDVYPQRAVVMMSQLFDLVERDHQVNRRTARSNWTYLNRLRRNFANRTVRECTSLMISHYQAGMQRSGRSAESINREFSVLRRAFKLGYLHDLVPRMPVVSRLPELKVRNEFFTRNEVDALLKHLPEYLVDVVRFAYLAGWRQGEVIGLLWANVNWSEAVIRLEPEQNKSRDLRVLALHGELAALIERRWQARKTGDRLSAYVFHRDGLQLAYIHRARTLSGKASLRD